MQKRYLKKQKKGFVSIFAIFFSAIIVSVLTAMYILLVKQIEILNVDYSSFQAIYTADSLFECVLYKEKIYPTTQSIFIPANAANLGNCGVGGDMFWQVVPVEASGRSSSIINFNLTTPQGDFCGVASVAKQISDAQDFSSISFSGQSRNCATTGAKVIERLIEFYY